MPRNLAHQNSDAIAFTSDFATQDELAERYRALFENANDIIYSHDLKGNYTSINKAGEHLTGYSREDARKLNMAQIVAPEYQQLAAKMIKEKLEGMPSSLYEIEIITKNGDRLPLEVNTHLLYRDGKPVGIQGVARDITSRRKREAALLASEQRYKQLVEEATDIIYRIDLTGRFTFVNPIATKFMQRSREELIGLHFKELIREDFQKIAEDFYRHQVKERIPVTYFEFPAVAKDGTEIWIGQNVQLLTHEGQLLELQAVARDITARKQVEERLLESERRYRALFDLSPYSIFVYDAETLEFVAVNEAAVRTYGYSQEELLSVKVQDLWSGEEVLLITDQDSTRIAKHQRKDGSTIHVEIASRPVTLSGRKSIVVIATDITERIRAQAARQVMLDVIQSVNITQDLDELLNFIHRALKKVLYAENFFVALFNKETGSFEVPFFADFADSACDPQQMKKSCAAYIFRTQKPLLITPPIFERLVAEGEIELVGTPSPSWLGVPLQTPAETIGVLAVQHYEDENAYSERDLQFLSSIGGQIALAIERKRAEESLRISEERFSKAFNFTPLSMSLVSLESLRIIDVNNSFLELNGYQRKSVVGRSASELNLWGGTATQSEFLQELRRVEIVRDYEIQAIDKEANNRTYLISAEMIELHGEKCILSVINDITEHRALEEQLRQSQRMESIGQLAGGIAHDFNNLLTAITGYSEISLKRLGLQHPVSRNIEQIHKAGSRAASLTRQLLAFSRRQMLQPKVLDLNSLISDMEKMLRRLIGEDIDLVTMLRRDLGEIKADPGQIEQVVLNLVVNARDAMPKGGMITIETANVELDQSYSRSHPPLIPGSYVLLAVSDTGVGIDAATQKRIFEPFFTTKEVGKGTGLGLSTVYGIVKQSDGYIWVYSEVGKGTTFKVYLPRLHQKDQVEVDGAMLEPPHGNEAVLIVEDEDTVRNLARAILEEKGYSVLTAANGEEGLRVFEEMSGRFDIVITDVVMPVMSGSEMAKRIGSLQPQAKILYMSGYTDDAIVRHGVLEHNVFFLQKPFTAASLAEKVREVLDSPADSSDV